MSGIDDPASGCRPGSARSQSNLVAGPANGCAAACTLSQDARACWNFRILRPPPEQSPRVLGVDEFAFRKGRTYGTLLVDVEASRVVDVLPDRTSETFAARLREHPGAEIICQDRATAYTREIKEAAPDAVEVADRWHLLQNLAAVVEKTCHQHRACLRKRADEETSRVPEAPPLMQLPLHELPRTQITERTRHRFADVHKLVAAGWTISAIARRLHLDHKTVRRFREGQSAEVLLGQQFFSLVRQGCGRCGRGRGGWQGLPRWECRCFARPRWGQPPDRISRTASAKVLWAAVESSK
ncbi:transposase [Streptomyces sp. NPDC127051]|uniref:transposase n=1 Tax=Streptomyces sp. NPDC127051 TaxID=3347119 RepID=UPI00364F64F4